eukprot:5602183-Amphidinium_carterae.1
MKGRGVQVATLISKPPKLTIASLQQSTRPSVKPAPTTPTTRTPCRPPPHSLAKNQHDHDKKKCCPESLNCEQEAKQVGNGTALARFLGHGLMPNSMRLCQRLF